MIQKFVDKFMENREAIEATFKQKHPENYKEIVKTVVSNIVSDSYGQPDPTKIHCIDDGDYQGTLLFIIPENSYQPHNYWFVKVYYGSCSGCDTLEGIRNYDDATPTEEQAKEYMTLALHIVQGIKPMQENE